MKLSVTGLNHTTAPVDIRERVAFGPEVIVPALQALAQQPHVRECMILSTCNRTELYCTFEDAPHLEQVETWLHNHFGLDAGTLSPYLYHHTDQQAVEHIMAVAAGLNSLVLGEPQILGQLKDAYQTAKQAGTLQQRLEWLMQQVFATAKKVRSETAIGENPVSVAFAAVSLARQFFGDLSEQTALLIGAGETCELVGRHLREAGIGHLIVANRTFDKAHDLAQQLGGFAIALDELKQHLPDADLLISSTASPTLLVERDDLAQALKQRRHRPIFAVDIAVPRDIDPAAGDLEDLYLYTVDDLQSIIEHNRKAREAAAAEAHELIRLQAEKVMARLRTQAMAAPLIRDFRTRAERVKSAQLEEALAQLQAGQNPEAVLTRLANQLTHKLIHHPTVYLRQAGESGDAHRLDMAAELLGLKPRKDTNA
ncbi:glutamyl-tRNA reductase [Sulfurivirga caldicuralii]|uniref:Glutamyl-tRNA reductase n=1 Tax=Sulfurivirga caldicuralii TaxID=364032 RepID=A0A1N6GJH6_9GAMM|nr:glutamyl-tRNA reductase [Sulfurivirga caldicuralii]SIO07677.1 glutamyl-tRNA reductase [Sulfurivirga caldicuralii]